MPAGIEVYDSSGKLNIGTNYRGLRLLKVLEQQPLTGSVTITNAKKGEEIIAFAMPIIHNTWYKTLSTSHVGVNGNNVSWNFSEKIEFDPFNGIKNSKANIFVFGRAK